jgi:hypothetical protein
MMHTLLSIADGDALIDNSMYILSGSVLVDGLCQYYLPKTYYRARLISGYVIAEMLLK